MSVKKRYLAWDACDDLFFGKTKWVLYIIPFLIYISTFLVPDNYVAILPNNAIAQIKYSELFPGKIAYTADVLGIYYAVIFVYAFAVYLTKGFSRKTKRLIREQEKMLTDLAGGMNMKILSLAGLMFCFIHLSYIFMSTGSATGKYSAQYIWLHSSPLLYFVSQCAMNFLFILCLMVVFVYWEASK